jgi:hypothetical protein
MNTDKLKDIWNADENNPEEARILNLQAWALNLQSVEMIQSHKSKSQLTSLLVNRILEVIILIPITLLWGNLLYKNLSDIPVAVSFGIILIFSVCSLVNCIRQLFILSQIKYSENIAGIQEKLAILQTHIIQYLRISFLFLPFYMVYVIVGFKLFANIDIIIFTNQNWFLFYLLNSALLIPVSLWLYKQVTYKNINKRWVRVIIESVGGKSVAKSMGFLKEIEEFRKDKV